MRSFSDELYHYGVKGMKRGVRHDREKVGNRRVHDGRKSSKNTNRFTSSNGVHYGVISDTSGTLEKFYDIAKAYYQRNNGWGPNNDKIVSWDKAYTHAFGKLTSFEQALVVALQLLVENQMTYRFEVCTIDSGVEDPPFKIAYYDKKTDEVITTFKEAVKRKNEDLRNNSRKRNVDSSTKVSVKKGSKVSSGSGAASQDSQYTWYVKPGR